MSKLLYYIDDYSDEFVPCDCTLEGWAKWLSEPDEGWGRDEAAKEGDQFRASVMRLDEDIIATRSGDSFDFSRPVPEDAFLAIRWGPGLGWDPDNICGNEAELLERLREDGEDEENIAVGFNEPEVLLTYHDAGGSPRLTVGRVQ